MYGSPYPPWHSWMQFVLGLGLLADGLWEKHAHDSTIALLLIVVGSICITVPAVVMNLLRALQDTADPR